jgi:hypothetical protein
METAPAYSNEFLDSMRLTGDEAADEALLSVFVNLESKQQLRSWLEGVKTNVQLEKGRLLLEPQGFFPMPETFFQSELMQQAAQLPAWANAGLMKKGSQFFAAHAEVILNLLGLLSLPYCYAAADGAMVLQLSERMRNDTGKRLFDTADFVWDVMAPDAFDKLGSGFASIVKVRLGHAAARYYTLKNPEWNKAWGLPVNQEDMAGTNLSMSLIVIRGMRKLGFTVQYEEQQAFMHLWNVIGALLGIRPELLPETGKEAQLLEASIRTRHFKASPHGQSLTRSLTDYLSHTAKEQGLPTADLLGLMRFLLGDDLSRLLDIKTPKLSGGTLRILKSLNFVNDWKPTGNYRTAYHQAHRKFRMQKPVLR